MTVIKLPDPLERRAQNIDAALSQQCDANDRSDAANQDWRRATLNLAIELAGAREDLRADQAFGKWCNDHFGDNRLPYNERAILVRWGADPEGTRAMLAKTDSRSIQMIERRLHSAMKTTHSTTPKREEAEASIRAHKAAYGVYPTVIEAGRESGLSRIVIEPALAAVKAEDRVAPAEVRYTKAQDLHVEARIKVEVKAATDQLHRSFEKEVEKRNKADIDKLFPDLEKMREDAKRTEKLYRSQLEKIAIFTEAEYRDILLCTHEGNPSKETRERAFIALNTKKLQLTGRG